MTLEESLLSGLFGILGGIIPAVISPAINLLSKEDELNLQADLADRNDRRSYLRKVAYEKDLNGDMTKIEKIEKRLDVLEKRTV